jgi:hypothetical protein
MCSLSFAGNPGKKGDTQAKMIATGIIASVDAKQHCITLAPPAGQQQQAQMQSAVPQKSGKDDTCAAQTFKVYAKTVVTFQSAQQGAVQSGSAFDLLKTGQAVRVVYVNDTTEHKHHPKKGSPAQQSETPTAQQSVPSAPGAPMADAGKGKTPAVGSAQQSTGQQTAAQQSTAQQSTTQQDTPVVPQKGKPGAPITGKLVALSIEILSENAMPAK